MEQDELVRLLVREHVKLSAYIWSFVRHDQVTEDILQEVSMQAVRSQATITGEAHLLAWLRRVARNQCLNSLRASSRRTAALDDDLLEVLEVDWQKYDRTSSYDVMDALKTCVEKLSPGNRRLISLRFGEDLRGQALAARLGRKLNAVHVALSRVYRALGDCIRRQLVEEQR